jgi:hypothetical protein
MPYEAMGSSTLRDFDSTPPGILFSDSADISVATPPESAGWPQHNVVSLHSSVLLGRVIRRAQLFVQGRYSDLVRDMEKHEMR